MSRALQMVYIYVAVMSVIGFISMGIDKIKAKKDVWRTPEKNLLLLAFAGGGLGVWLGMEVFRHKTKHLQFKYGVPLITLLEFIIVCYVFTT